MKNRSELAKGITLAQIGQNIAHAVVDNGGTDEDTKKILQDKDLCKEIAEIILSKSSVNNEVFEIPSCDGTKIITDGAGVFSSVDLDFIKFGLNEKENATKETSVGFVKHDGIVDEEFFDGICKNLNDACLTRHQIFAFNKNKKLHRNNLEVDVFLTKRKNKFFVVGVDVCSGGLCVFVFRLEDAYEMNDDHRFRVVVPQRALKSLKTI